MTAPLITTQFDSTSTATDVVSGEDLHGVRAVVTGGASGIGVATARALALAGAEVTLAVRNTVTGAHAAEAIHTSTGNHEVRVRPLDLAERTSVARFVEDWDGPLHLLVNNAGVIPSSLLRNSQGWELQFATNYLGHFLLTLGLHDALGEGASARGEARVVSLSSGGHQRSPVVFDDIHFERRPYDPQAAYAQSKTADALFAVVATTHWSVDGIFVNAVNPGGVATGLQRDFTPQHKEYLAKAEAEGVFTWKTPDQGAATTLVAAIAPELARTGGHYLSNCNEAPTVPDDADPFENGDAVKRWANDPAEAQKLWEATLELIDR